MINGLPPVDLVEFGEHHTFLGRKSSGMASAVKTVFPHVASLACVIYCGNAPSVGVVIFVRTGVREIGSE